MDDCVLVPFVQVSLQTYVAVEVPLTGGGVVVPQSDGIVRRAGEKGGWRQTRLRQIQQLRINLKHDQSQQLSRNVTTQYKILKQFFL